MLRLSVMLAACLAACSIVAAAPREIGFSDLPTKLQQAHAGCAGQDDTVFFSAEKFSDAVVFLISCPRERTASWPESLRPRYDLDVAAGVPVGIYVASDLDGTGAQRIAFPLLDDAGAMVKVTTLPVSAEALHESADPDNSAPPWIEALWKPDTRPDICKIMGSWRIADGVAELRRWRVAPFCNKDGPQYETRLNSVMPRLVVDRQAP
jgi:hypothetical protein